MLPLTAGLTPRLRATRTRSTFKLGMETSLRSKIKEAKFWPTMARQIILSLPTTVLDTIITYLQLWAFLLRTSTTSIGSSVSQEWVSIWKGPFSSTYWSKCQVTAGEVSELTWSVRRAQKLPLLIPSTTSYCEWLTGSRMEMHLRLWLVPSTWMMIRRKGLPLWGTIANTLLAMFMLALRIILHQMLGNVSLIAFELRLLDTGLLWILKHILAIPQQPPTITLDFTS